VKITLPELSLVVLVGASGAGKSTFARKHFLPTEIISSDFCRGLVSDDENSLDATGDAFEVLHFIAAKRLARGKLTVVDATNVQPEARAPLIALAKKYHTLATAIVLNVPEATCHARNESRPDRNFGPHVVRNHTRQLRRSLRSLSKEGFRHVFVLSPEEIENTEITRQPLWNNRKFDRGPFDIIGDLHGCGDELEQLLGVLGYTRAGESWKHPEGRKVVFLGDLVDRGPRVVDVLRLVMAMCESGDALCVPGNHDVKLLRHLRGKKVNVAHGLQETLDQFAALPEDERAGFTKRVADFLDGLISHYVLDDGKLVVAHAGLKEELQGRASGAVRSFTLFGETTGETDEFGLPVRFDWAREYRGSAAVVYGHTPVPRAEWFNNTINIDTGCVFGGRLSALRWPERELVSVDAAHEYSAPAKPFLQSEGVHSSQQSHDDVLDLADVTGKRIVSTRLVNAITIREENSIAALEVMSRFAAAPQWLIYLPPTMSPCATSTLDETLEHPQQAFEYFRENAVQHIVCEEKHMGSRAVVIVCKDVESAQQRFGVREDKSGIVLTRTGRPFFNDENLELQLLQILQNALLKSGLWEELETSWLCLDCELMPWSVKAQELLHRQYAPVGAAAQAALAAADDVLRRALQNGGDVTELQGRWHQRLFMAQQYAMAYRRYVWDVEKLEDLKLAPFHLLASEGKVHHDRDHLWHMAQSARICVGDVSGVLLATAHRTIDLQNESECEATVRWWEELTARDGEGMVVKPLEFICQTAKGLVQPAIKCRGREYLRIIYGPEYSAPENLKRLRSRGLGHKRALALREFALGIEGLERFVAGEPLRRVHECAFGVLALESEPVDPRL
jgi:protein phosphatase